MTMPESNQQSRPLVAELREFVESYAIGSNHQKHALTVLDSLEEQLEAAQRERSHLAQRARSFFIDYEDDCPHPVAMFLDDISVDPASNPASSRRDCTCRLGPRLAYQWGDHHAEDCIMREPASRLDDSAFYYRTDDSLGSA